MYKKYTQLILFFKLYINFPLYLQHFIDVIPSKYLYIVTINHFLSDLHLIMVVLFS